MKFPSVVIFLHGHAKYKITVEKPSQKIAWLQGKHGEVIAEWATS